jgi:CHAD domain-containing protein
MPRRVPYPGPTVLSSPSDRRTFPQLSVPQHEVTNESNAAQTTLPRTAAQEATTSEMRNDSMMAPAQRGEKITPEKSAEDVIRQLLGNEVSSLLRNDPLARGGIDPEGIHQLRVASRRLRAELTVVASIFENEPLHHFLGELRWLGRTLGKLRDLDIREAMLHHVDEDLPPWLGNTFDAIRMRQKIKEGHHVQQMLKSTRYRRLITDLAGAVIVPPLNEHANDPAVNVLSTGLRESLNMLFSTVDSFGPKPNFEELHQIRILAKKARYSAGVASFLFDKRSKNIANSLEEVQTILGDLHDRVVALAYLDEEFTKVSAERSTINLTGPSAAVHRRLGHEIDQLSTRWQQPYAEARRQSTLLFPQ